MKSQRDTIRFKLLQNSLTQTWLINRLELYGVATDKSELSSALSGTRKGAKVEKIIQNSLDILTEYEEKMAVYENTES